MVSFIFTICSVLESNLHSFPAWGHIYFTNLTIFVPRLFSIDSSLLDRLDIFVVSIFLWYWFAPCALPLPSTWHPAPQANIRIPLSVNCDLFIPPATWDFHLPWALFSPNWWGKITLSSAPRYPHKFPQAFPDPNQTHLVHILNPTQLFLRAPWVSPWLWGVDYLDGIQHHSVFQQLCRKQIWFLPALQNYSQYNAQGDPE